MEMVIAILLWMQALCGGQQYTQAEYEQLVQQNQPVINQVMSDPVQQQAVWQLTGTEVPTVVVGELE